MTKGKYDEILEFVSINFVLSIQVQEKDKWKIPYLNTNSSKQV